MSAAPFTLGFDVRFEEAVARARARKVVLPETFYADLPIQARARAFTISGLASLDQIARVFESLQAATAEGTAFGEWQKSQAADLGALPAGRRELIFRNAVQNHYNAGRWAQIDANAARRPFVLFSGIEDRRQTAICRALDGLILPADHPYWSTHSPQLHHACRSHLIAITEAQARARGWRPGASGPAVTADEGFGTRPDRDRGAGLATLAAARAAQAPPPVRDAALRYFAPAELLFTRRAEEAALAASLARQLPDLERAYPRLPTLARRLSRDAQVPYAVAATLVAYTGDEYEALNELLRARDLSQLDRAGPEVAALAAGVADALAALPAAEGALVLRGVDYPLAVLARLQRSATPGAVLVFDGFTSAGDAPFGGNVVMRLHSLTGRRIRDYSLVGGEEEVLFPPGAHFLVLDSVEAGGVLYLDLQEVLARTDRPAPPPSRHFSALEA